MQITCPAEGEWPVTNALATSMISCGAGFFGERSRYCSASGVWGEVIETACRRLATRG